MYWRPITNLQTKSDFKDVLSDICYLNAGSTKSSATTRSPPLSIQDHSLSTLQTTKHRSALSDQTLLSTGSLSTLQTNGRSRPALSRQTTLSYQINSIAPFLPFLPLEFSVITPLSKPWHPLSTHFPISTQTSTLCTPHKRAFPDTFCHLLLENLRVPMSSSIISNNASPLSSTLSPLCRLSSPYLLAPYPLSPRSLLPMFETPGPDAMPAPFPSETPATLTPGHDEMPAALSLGQDEHPTPTLHRHPQPGLSLLHQSRTSPFSCNAPKDTSTMCYTGQKRLWSGMGKVKRGC